MIACAPHLSFLVEVLSLIMAWIARPRVCWGRGGIGGGVLCLWVFVVVGGCGLSVVWMLVSVGILWKRVGVPL